MAGPRAEIVGVARFDQTLDAAAEAIDNMERAIEATNTLIAADARRRAPRLSGRLASSITTGAEKNQALIGSDLVYAPVIHWGWPARGISPSLFLVEAAEQTRSQWIGYFEEDMETAISKVKGA